MFPNLYRAAAVVLSLVLTGCGGVHQARIETLPNGKKAERIYTDLGGFVDAEMRSWRQRVTAHGIQAFILDGTCASFCTFVALYAPESCYTRNVRFFVHPAAKFGMVETAETRAFTQQAVAHWPKGLQDWWRKNRPGIAGVTLRYSDLVRIIPERACPEALHEGDPRKRIREHGVNEIARR